jgi:glycosyltransferase involved in cell wall biosynthesis
MSIAERALTETADEPITSSVSTAPAENVPIDAAGGPLAVATLDLADGNVEMRTPVPEAASMSRAFVLLRDHSWPVGIDVLPMHDGNVSATMASQLRREVPSSTSRSGRTDLPFSVVVCTRNRTHLLERSLPALLELMTPERELIVVDNAPRDNRTAELVATFGNRVRYVVEPTPGLARARNCGLAAAGGKFVVFTDDDVDPDPAWLDVLSATFDSHAGAVCVSGSVLPASLTTEAELRFQEFGGYQRNFEENEFHLALDPAPSKLFPFHPRLVGTGANMAFRTEALQSIGGFDDALGAGTPSRGGEDIDVAVRLLLAGHLVVRQPSAVVWHGSHAEMADLTAQLEDYGCGLAAAFTKFMGQRKIAPLVLRRVPAGLGALLSPTSVKNDTRSDDYPTELRNAEWRGLRAGPLAYRTSRRQARRLRRVGT